MKKATYTILLFLSIAGAFLAGSWYSQWGGVKPTDPTAANVVHHVESTHAAHESHGAGITPVSGPQHDSAHVHGAALQMRDGAAPTTPGVVVISREKQQLIGVQISLVEKTSGTRVLRLFGRVAPDEARLYRINAGIEGAIREVSAVTTGSWVKKDQLLATFSAPGALSTIQLFILNSNAADRAKLGPSEGQNAAALAASNLRQRLDQLHNIGMSVQQMEEIAETKLFPGSIRILAPADGFVLARNVSPGLKFEKGVEFFRIASLSRVWILADVFENEAHHLRPGARAQVSLPNQRKTLPARVSEVLPQFDAATRTLKVRLETDNPGYMLRPDMFVDVELPITLPPTIAVPTGALLDSGLKKMVFIDRGEGFFEPRQVETGWRFGDRVEIVKGLSPGERIVTSGTFLLDSESKIKLAAEGARGTARKAEVTQSQGEHHHGH